MATLRVVQFNVLAPSARVVAPLDAAPWRERHAAVCDALLGLRPDLVCLQEFDFAPETADAAGTFAELYEARLGAGYRGWTARRTGRKKEGLALYASRAAFDVAAASVGPVPLQPGFADRVALAGRLRHRATGRDVVVVNTHLTVAHASNDHDIPSVRPRQMEQVLDLLRVAGEGDAALLCADMNCDHLDEGESGPFPAAAVARPVTMALERGFTSAFHAAHPGTRPMSHTSSYARDGCVDYVLFRGGPVELAGAFLHPEGLAADAPWVAGRGWGGDRASTLSDHRPLVADFRVRSASAAAEWLRETHRSLLQLAAAEGVPPADLLQQLGDMLAAAEGGAPSSAPAPA